MELFLSQNDFTVRAHGGLSSLPREGSGADAVIYSPGKDALPKAEELSALKEAACDPRVYLLGERYNREEIARLLQMGINGIFNRPLRPLAIIQKLKEDLGGGLEAGAKAGSPGRGGHSLALGTHELKSGAWQRMANAILAMDDIPAMLFVESSSELVFRFFVEKLHRRLPDTHLAYLDGPEPVVRAGVVAEIEYGQWRRPPVAAIHARGMPRKELIDFFLDDLGLLASEDPLIRLVLGSRHGLDVIAGSGIVGAETASVLREASIELPGGDVFVGDWERLLEFRVKELVSSFDAAERAKVVIPEDLFEGMRLSSELSELEAFAHWLAARLGRGEWPDEEGLRALAAKVDVFAEVSPQCFFLGDEVEARAVLFEDALTRMANKDALASAGSETH